MKKFKEQIQKEADHQRVFIKTETYKLFCIEHKYIQGYQQTNVRKPCIILHSPYVPRMMRNPALLDVVLEMYVDVPHEIVEREIAIPVTLLDENGNQYSPTELARKYIYADIGLEIVFKPLRLSIDYISIDMPLSEQLI